MKLINLFLITALILPNAIKAIGDDERDRASSSTLSMTITEEEYNSMQAGSLTQAASFETDFERTRQQQRTLMKYGMIVSGLLYGMVALSIIAITVYNVARYH